MDDAFHHSAVSCADRARRSDPNLTTTLTAGLARLCRMPAAAVARTPFGKPLWAACLVAMSTAVPLTGCSGGLFGLHLIPAAGVMAVARLEPRNGSTVRGTISFTQRGDRVWITGNFVELWPGPHSIYIHAVGNCSSANAASAGPVWNLSDATGDKRTGSLPQLNVATEGHATLQTISAAFSVGTGKPDDVVGHSVVVHAGLDPDPKAEFGVRNGWLACGVIERSEGLDLQQLL
jgi:Cu-Zn family superoxide dismutase